MAHTGLKPPRTTLSTPAGEAVAELRKAKRCLENAMRILETATIDVPELANIDSALTRVTHTAGIVLDRIDECFER